MNAQSKMVRGKKSNNHTSEILVDCNELVGDTIPTLDSVRDFRLTVAYLFLNVHGGEEDCEENPWCGKNGIIAKIRESMNLCRGTRIDHILRDVLECKKLGLRYAGESEKFNCGRTVSIQHDTSEAQIIIDAIENGSSMPIAWNLVNQHRKEEGGDSITKSAVYQFIQKCKPVKIPLGSRKQGSSDPDSNIAKARLGWCRQLGVRFGCYDHFEEFLKPNGLSTEDMPKYFDPNFLRPLYTDGFATWDETHRKVQPGSASQNSRPMTNRTSHFLSFLGMLMES